MIRLNDFKRQWQDVGDDAVAAFEGVGESGWYVLGEAVDSFENWLSSWWGSKHAIGVASGLDALEISLRVLGCSHGDKVLTTPVSAFATSLAIVRTGGVPIFGPIDDRGMLDLDGVRQMLSASPDIRFLVPVHLYGHSLDPEKLAILRKDFELAIVEDCAQSAGATWNSVPTGLAGQMAATSFYPTKTLGAMGDAGAILTEDDGFARAARMHRDYGQSSKYQHELIGSNSRLDEVQAAVMLATAGTRVNRWIERRRAIAQRYLEAIGNRHVSVPALHPRCRSSWHLFPIRVPIARKRSFIEALEREGIQTGEHYPIAIPDQTAIGGWQGLTTLDRLQLARDFCSSEVSLPIHPYLRDAEVEAIIQAVNQWNG